MSTPPYPGGNDDSSDDEDYRNDTHTDFPQYPVHDCCEFEDFVALKRLICVRKDDSDDSSSSNSSTGSECHDEESSVVSTSINTSCQIITSKPPHSKTSEDQKNQNVNRLKSGTGKINGDELTNIQGENEIQQNSKGLSQAVLHNGYDTKKNPDKKVETDSSVKQGENDVSVEVDRTKDILQIFDKNNAQMLSDKRSVNISPEKCDSLPMKIDNSESLVLKKNIMVTTAVTCAKTTIQANGNEINKSLSPNASNIQCRQDTKERDICLTNSMIRVEASSVTNDTVTDKEGSSAHPDGIDTMRTKAYTVADVHIGPQHSENEEVKKEFKRQKTKKSDYYCPFDLDERDDDGNTALHIAIHSHKLDCVRLLLDAGADVHKKCDGSAPVHLVVSLGAIAAHSEFAEKCLSLLSSHGADFAMKDDSMHTPLYLACMSNVPRCAQIILSDPRGKLTLNFRADRTGGRALHACAKYGIKRSRNRRRTNALLRSGDRNEKDNTRQDFNTIEEALITKVLISTPGIDVDALNNYGQTALHVAASRGNWSTARLLLEAGSNPRARDRRNHTPGQLSSKRGIIVPNDLKKYLFVNGDNADSTVEMDETNVVVNGSSKSSPSNRDPIIDPDANTILLCHELCDRHQSCQPIRRGVSLDPPPENVRRLHVLLNKDVGILRSLEFQGCSWETEARRAAMSDVLRVHEYPYVERISQLCSSIPDHPSAISSLDPDTAVSRWSFEAAMRAAGSVCEAVDKVIAGDHRNAFCVVRPPGHHAGPRGIVTCPNDPEGSHGFCLLNNVAIGAAYARSMYRNDGIRKIAIVDFDVHHGNGTEEIIRQLTPNKQSATVRTPFAFGTLQNANYKPWLDEEDINEIFFASAHGYGPRDINHAGQPERGGWFYPASGASHISTSLKEPSSIERMSLHDFLSTQTWARIGEEARLNCCKVVNVGLDLPRSYDTPGMQRVEVRDAYRKKILPHLLNFDPDIIFISAGFDGHKRDGMNFGYVGIIEDDYEWITDQLVKVANSCCQGRIVSVLEGGYKLHGGIISPFARSVASHVRALVEGGSSRELYSEEDAIWESNFEKEMVSQKDRRRQMKGDRFRISEDGERRSSNLQGATQGIPPTLEKMVRKDDHKNSDDFNNISSITGESSHDIDMLKEPLSELAGSTIPTGISGSTDPDNSGKIVEGFNISLSPFVTSQPLEAPLPSDDPTPARKRRRGPVDYKELFEQMKKEGSLVG